MIRRILLALKPRPRIPHHEYKRIIGKEFLTSWEWAGVRMDALEKNDGRCECCGRNKHQLELGEYLNVDHIKPRARFPHLALERSNLQVLCGMCNRGKGNRYSTDWRK